MGPPKQKQPQVKKGLCRVLEHVDVDVHLFKHFFFTFFTSIQTVLLVHVTETT